MKNKISNPKTEVPTGIQLNDKDYLNNTLAHLKEEAKNLAIVLTEISNEKLYKEINKMFNAIITLQRKAFELAFKNGWYSLEKANESKIDEKYKELNQEFSDLSN